MTTLTDRPYVARHLGFDYTTTQAQAEQIAAVAWMERGEHERPTASTGKHPHAAYTHWRVTNPERRPAVELPDEVTP